MIHDENLDVRTVTMGINLLDCADPNPKAACDKIYEKIVRHAQNLVPVCERITVEYGIPIVNKRVAVTPIALLLGCAPQADPVCYAKALDRAADTVGINFIGGYSALVHKGFAAGDVRLLQSIPQALSETEKVCSSVNIGTTKSGINMDAVAMMGDIILETARRTADRNCIGAAKLVVFCNAPEDNPFMAGAFHGVGEPDVVINIGVSGPGAVRSALQNDAKGMDLSGVAEIVKRTAFKITRMGQLVGEVAGKAPGRAVRHCGSVAGSHARRRRQHCRRAGRDGAGNRRRVRHHRRAGASERRGQKRRRHGQRHGGRPVRRVHPRQRGRGHDPAPPNWAC